MHVFCMIFQFSGELLLELLMFCLLGYITVLTPSMLMRSSNEVSYISVSHMLILSLASLWFIHPDLVCVSPFAVLGLLFICGCVLSNDAVQLAIRHTVPGVSFLALLDGSNMITFLPPVTI